MKVHEFPTEDDEHNVEPRCPLSAINIDDPEERGWPLVATVTVDLRGDGVSVDVLGPRGRGRREALFAAALELVRTIGARI